MRETTLSEARVERQPFLKSGLITLLAGFSATAIFAATGFIASFGREQFLGINLSDWSVQTLSILAGRCAADSFFLVLNLTARHWVVVVGCASLIGAGVVLMRHRKVPAFFPPAAECLLALPILIWLLAVIASFEAPTIALRGWVLASGGETPLSTAIRQLHPEVSIASSTQSKKYVQAAMAKTAAAPGITQLEGYYFSNRKDGPGALLLESSSDDVGKQLDAIGFRYHTPDAARNLLYDEYAQALAACVLAFCYILLSRQCPESKIWSDLLLVLRTSVILLSAVATVLLPYAYGKLVDSALFPNAHVTYSEPSTDPSSDKPSVKNGEFPVLSQDDKSVSLLWIQGGGGHTKIVQVPREKILILNFEADVDALAKISECIASPGGSCQ